MSVMTFRQVKDICILYPVGKIDFDATGAIRDEFQEATRGLFLKHMVVDLSGVTRMDSAGLGLFVAMKNHLAKGQVSLTLCGLGVEVLESLRYTHLSEYFDIVATEADALKKLGGEEGTRTL